MAEFINTVDVIGDDALTDSIINRSIAEYRDYTLGTIGQYAFYNCTALTTVDSSAVTSIGNNAFENCSSLTTLILRGTTNVVTLSNSNAFTSSKIASGTGYIYVPKTLADGTDGVAAYQAATNWSTYANQFRAIEDYPEICGG